MLRSFWASIRLAAAASMDLPAVAIRSWLVVTLLLRALNAAVAASASSPDQDAAIEDRAASRRAATSPRPSAAFVQVSAACIRTTGCALAALSSFASLGPAMVRLPLRCGRP